METTLGCLFWIFVVLAISFFTGKNIGESLDDLFTFFVGVIIVGFIIGKIAEWISSNKSSNRSNLKELDPYNPMQELSADEIKQLELERYIHKRNKSPEEIGADYELFILQEYLKDGWEVEHIGAKFKEKDGGIDLIARKDNEIHIIQCKRWAKNKTIHENVVNQLHGAATHYKLSEKINDYKVIPVLITSTKLSETAKEVAQTLGVKIIEYKEFQEFPRIKCSVNNGNKVYYMPHYSPYDFVEINPLKGDSFAWTIEEAVNKDFKDFNTI